MRRKSLFFKIAVGNLPDRAGTGKADIIRVSGLREADCCFLTKIGMSGNGKVELLLQHDHDIVRKVIVGTVL